MFLLQTFLHFDVARYEYFPSYLDSSLFLSA